MRQEDNNMNIRRAEDRDIERIKELLVQVLNIHAEGRPDLFIPNTTKYTTEELKEIIADPQRPIFVGTDENDRVLGYAFCIMQKRLHSNNMTDIKTLFIDDLCVDETCRGMHVGRAIYEYVEAYAREQGCYHITLNVWSFNTPAKGFYEKIGLKPMETTLEKILK